MKLELEIAAIQLDEVLDVAQPSTSSGIGKHSTKSDSKKMKLAKGEKKNEKSKKKIKKSRKSFKLLPRCRRQGCHILIAM